jgi:CubicO group peptidase (beta-lactamase class C family)
MDDLSDAIDAVAAETDFSGVAGIATDDSDTFAVAYGLADRAHDVANTPATRFAIASGTKGFTALAVMRLVETGLVDLTTTARSVLGSDLPLVDDGVTVEQLLAHRSGIGDYLDEDDLDAEDHVLTVPLHTLDTVEAWLPVLDGHPQIAPPGTTFAYNNGGYVLLALLAERISLVPFAALLDELVLHPAGIGDTTGFHRADAVTPGLAVGYLDDGRTNALHLPAVGAGDGGMSSTLADVERFWREVATGGIVGEATFATMTRDRSGATGDDPRYGLGFWLAPAGDAVWLEGCDAGISFRSVHEPGTHRTRTVMSNTTDGAWPVLRTLAERLA